MFLEKFIKKHQLKIPVGTSFRAPMGGESVSVVCKNKKCGYRGHGILAGPKFCISRTLANNKCPKCGKRTLIMNPWVVY